MIRNYSELLVLIDKAEKQILALTVEKQNQLLQLNFKKARAILRQQLLLRFRIAAYINTYEEIIKSHYLENRLYGPKLEDLKKLNQNIENTGDLIYCLQKLADQYHELLKDVAFFQKSGKISDATAIRLKIKNMLDQMEQLFSELARTILLLDFNPDRYRIAQYNSFTRFFSIYYSSKIRKLEYEFQAKKQAFKSISIIFNYSLFKASKNEIQQIKNEIKILHAAQKKLIFIDQIQWDIVVL